VFSVDAAGAPRSRHFAPRVRDIAGTRRRVPAAFASSKGALMIPLVSILLSAVGSFGYKLVESAFKSKPANPPGADFSKELQSRVDATSPTPAASSSYAQATSGVTASDAIGIALAGLSPAEAASEYSKLARQWPGRFPSGGVIDSLQAP
jgi:hypothetical protein